MGADNGDRDNLIGKVSEEKKAEKVLWSPVGRYSPGWGIWNFIPSWTVWKECFKTEGCYEFLQRLN